MKQHITKLPYECLANILSYHKKNKITINNETEITKIFYKFKNHYQLYNHTNIEIKYPIKKIPTNILINKLVINDEHDIFEESNKPNNIHILCITRHIIRLPSNLKLQPLDIEGFNTITELPTNLNFQPLDIGI
jgi:hypothetical protein